MSGRAIATWLNKIFFILFLLCLFVKFFTTVVQFRDDPSTLLVFRLIPGFDNKTTEIPPLHITILHDENGFIGEEFYFFTTNTLWILSGISWFILFIIFLLINKLQR